MMHTAVIVVLKGCSRTVVYTANEIAQAIIVSVAISLVFLVTRKGFGTAVVVSHAHVSLCNKAKLAI